MDREKILHETYLFTFYPGALLSTRCDFDRLGCRSVELGSHLRREYVFWSGVSTLAVADGDLAGGTRKHDSVSSRGEWRGCRCV